LPPPRKEALETLYRNGDPEAFFGVADVGRYDELFEGTFAAMSCIQNEDQRQVK
jgi:hypothetical protein